MLPFQSYLEHFGVAVAAITGVLAARDKRVDLFGVLVLALVTAFGGGTLRDAAIGDLPIFWVRVPHFVYTALIAALVTFFLARSHVIPPGLLQVADAFSLALFTIVGTAKALDFHAPPLIAVILGVATGVAGGILRDLLLNEIPLVFRPDIYLYATAAFFGAIVHVLLHGHGATAQTSTLTGIGAVLLLRLAGIRWHLRLPVFVPKDSQSNSTTHPTP